jgi:hypothetical protein
MDLVSELNLKSTRDVEGILVLLCLSYLSLLMGVGFFKAAVPLYVRFSSFFLDSLTLCLVRRRREKRGGRG